MPTLYCSHEVPGWSNCKYTKENNKEKYIFLVAETNKKQDIEILLSLSKSSRSICLMAL